jgi:hypothetical protein
VGPKEARVESAVINELVHDLRFHCRRVGALDN